jgi:hypothetical protein
MSRARDIADRVLHNRTHEDTEGGRESIVTFKGEQSGGEISTLAQIQASHDGTADDEKADLIFKTNDGSDGASPTEAMRIQSDQKIGVGLSSNISSQLHVNSEVSLGPDNNNRMIVGSTAAGVGSIGTIEGGTASFSTATFKGGKIGVGVADPTAPLTVKSPSNAEAIHIVGRSDDIGQIKFIEADGTTILSTIEARNSFVNLGSVANIPLTFMTNSSERMRVLADGKVTVGRSTALGNGQLTVQSNNGAGLAIGYGTGTNEYRRLYHHSSGLYFESSTNQAYLSAAGAWTNASDVTLKKDIEDIDYGIETTKKLKPRKYKMKSDDQEQIGFIAQELVEEVPEVVSGKDEILGVSYGQLTAVLTKAIQELSAKNDALESENTAIKARLDALEAE